MTKIVSILISLFLVIIVSPNTILAGETRTLAPNHSFENWSLQDGIQLPNNWVVVQSNNPDRTINRQQDMYEGVYSMELTGLFPEQEGSNKKATSIRSNLFSVKDFKQDKPLKLVVWIKPTNPNVETRGKLGLLDYNGFLLCERKFALPIKTSAWTKQTLLCPTSSFKTSVVLTQNSIYPAFYDNVSVIQTY